ncbi:MAG: methionine adenosyltransferase [Bacillota bacterium]
MEKRYATSESVTSGHPDKLADLIADSILDACLAEDKDSRVACEVLLTHNSVVIAGEITTKAVVDYADIALKTIVSVGYDITDLHVAVLLSAQSEDIASAVDGEETGAGDQGIMHGFATSEFLTYMPIATQLANDITDKLTECRERGIIEGLKPDGKSQVTVSYSDDGKLAVESINVSTQHEDWLDLETLEKEITQKVVEPFFEEYGNCENTIVTVNPGGRFVKGGFEADTGLTGRKIIADSYGPYCPHGGGAYSGKDGTKVDRSGAYMARYVAKNIVASGLAYQAQVSLSYVIGKSTPTSIDICTFGTSEISEDKIRDAVLEVFDFTVDGIIETLNLKEPIYALTTVGGHFGKFFFPWERTDKAEQLKAVALML